MKFRTNFVSNSSSSSFVMIGFKDTENISDRYEGNNIELLGLKIMYHDGYDCSFIGRILGYGLEDDYENTSVSKNDLLKMWDEVVELAKYFNKSENDVELIMGTISD